MVRRVLFFLCTLTFVFAAKPKVKGLSPTDIRSLQFDEKEFKCRDNSKTIPFSQVNDNYCDCSDGSDEPGTPACPNGKFWCRNIGYVGNEIFSTQVWDGICDCCDGSDEKDLKIKCKNTCLEKAAVAKLAHEKEVQLQQEGLNKKKDNIELAKKELAEKEQELIKLKEENQKLEEEKKILEEEHKKLEEESKEKELAAQKEAELKKVEQQGEEGDQKAQVEVGETVTSTTQTEQIQQTQEPQKQVIVDESKQEGEEEEDWEESLDELKPLSEELKVASEAVKKVEDNIRENERKIKEIEDLLANDFGEEKAFYYLHGNLYTVDTAEYTYELRPFDSVTQKSKTGSSGTNLGKWDLSKQTDAWKVSHKEMLYSDGLKCWGGPDRSTTVTILCGSETRIAEPNEPNKCEYTLKLYTPSACSQQHLQALQLNFGETGHDEEIV